MGTELVQYSFGSWVQKIELECEWKLLTPAERQDGLYCRWNLDGLKRGDFKARRDVLRLDWQAGLISREQWHEYEDTPIDEDGTYMTAAHLGGTATAATGGDQGEPPADDTAAAAPPADQAAQIGAAAAQPPVVPLNGAQITAAVSVIVQLRQGILTSEAAVALLVAVGLAADVAQTMVDSTVAAGALPTPDVAPTAKPTITAPAEQKPVTSSRSLADLYGKFLADACGRVTAKQDKAFANHEGKDGFDAWQLRFAEDQGVYLAEALNPFLETAYTDAGELAVACQSVCEDYAGEVRTYGKEADPKTVVAKLITKIEGDSGKTDI
jgi:hypothetical protein